MEGCGVAKSGCFVQVQLAKLSKNNLNLNLKPNLDTSPPSLHELYGMNTRILSRAIGATPGTWPQLARADALASISTLSPLKSQPVSPCGVPQRPIHAETSPDANVSRDKILIRKDQPLYCRSIRFWVVVFPADACVVRTIESEMHKGGLQGAAFPHEIRTTLTCKPSLLSHILLWLLHAYR